MTKGITSILIGIAIDKGYIESEELTIAEVFKDPSPFDNKAFQKIRIKHLLTMSSGIDNQARDEHPFAEPSLLSLMLSNDWYREVNRSQLRYAPGKRFHYNSVNYHILSMIFSETTGMSAGEFADEYLFQPLGIEHFVWEKDPHGNNYGWGNLKLSMIDLSKIAYLLSNYGQWQNEQIISKTWIDKMFTTQIKSGWNPILNFGYGYGWFLPHGIKNNFFAGFGRGGQCIYIFPKEELIVLTYGNYDISKLIFDIAKLSKGKTRSLNIETQAYRRTYNFTTEEKTMNINETTMNSIVGEWIADSNIFNICHVHFKGLSPNKMEMFMESPLIKLNGEISYEGDHVISNNQYSGNAVKTRITIDKKKHLTIEFDEVSNINTFLITVKPSKNDDVLMLDLYEHVLFPRSYSICLRRNDT